MRSNGQRRTLALSGVLAGFFIVMLDTTIVNVALPDIGADLGVGVAGLQWVVNAYTLVLAALLLSAGAACDRLGARTVYVFGLGWFGLMSVGCALAPSTTVLISARVLQGVGAAAIIPGSLALLAQLFPDSAARARAIGLWGGAGGVAAAVGPVLGGLLVSVVGWQAAFWVNLPIVALACSAILRGVSNSPGNKSRRLDWPGQVLSVAGLAVVTWAVVSAGEYGWTFTKVATLLAGIVLLVVFAVVERRTRVPMLPMR